MISIVLWALTILIQEKHVILSLRSITSILNGTSCICCISNESRNNEKCKCSSSGFGRNRALGR
jgi:hypothetical protein